MKVKIERSSFFDLISQANSLIEKRSIMPILSKVLISAKKDKLCVQATDQDNSLQSQVLAQVEKPGEVVIDAQSLYDILKQLPEGVISFNELDNKKLKLKQKASVFHLLGQNIQDFPAFPPFSMAKSFKVKSAILKHLVDKTSYCSSVDETRYHLTGVLFEAGKSVVLTEGKNEKECFRFVATDGHRLGLAECFMEKVSFNDKVIISKKGVQEIKKLISYASEREEVEVAVAPPRILFHYKDTILSIKLVEGKYPNYQPLIPKSSSVSVVLKTEDFINTLRRVSLLSSNRFKGVNFHIKEKQIFMETENPNLGSAQDEVACVRKKGKDLKVRFNARYILEALASMGCVQVLIEFGGSEAPCTLKPFLEEDKKDKKDKQRQSLCVVMPMKM